MTDFQPSGSHDSNSAKEQSSQAAKRITGEQIIKTIKELDLELKKPGIRHHYYRKELEEALVVAIALTVSAGGILSQQAISAIPVSQVLTADNDPKSPSQVLYRRLLKNSLLKKVGENNSENAAIINSMLGGCRVVGEVLRYYFLDEHETKESLDKFFITSTAPLDPEYPPAEELFGRDFAKFVSSHIRKVAPALNDEEILHNTCFAAKPGSIDVQRYRVSFFDVSSINRRKVRALCMEGVPADDVLTSTVLVSATLLTAKQALSTSLSKKLEYLLQIAPNFTRRPGGSNSSARDFIRNGVCISPRIRELGQRVRFGNASLRALEKELTEKYNLNPVHGAADFRMLMYHRPSRLGEGSKELAKAGSLWTYCAAAKAVLSKDSEELSYIANLFRVCGSDAVALRDQQMKVMSKSATDQLPDSATIVAGLFAPRKTIDEILKERAPAARDVLLSFMAAELTAILANFDQIDFPEHVSPDVQLRILETVVSHAGLVADITSELSGLPLEKQRPLSKRERIQNEALMKAKDRSLDGEIIEWSKSVLNNVYLDLKHNRKMTVLHTSISLKGYPSLIVEKHDLFDNKEILMSPWKLRLMIEHGEVVQAEGPRPLSF